MTDIRAIIEGLTIFEKWIPNEGQHCRVEIGALISGLKLWPQELDNKDREMLYKLGWAFDEDTEEWTISL